MNNHYLNKSSKVNTVNIDIFSKKSALILRFLLLRLQKDEAFSQRTIVRQTNVSVGWVQRVIDQLVTEGYILVHGVRTAKTFRLKNRKKLLQAWVNSYRVMKKCKVRNYDSALSAEQIRAELSKPKFKPKVALALHSASGQLVGKNSNLDSVEFYLLDEKLLQTLEKKLYLEAQDRGYKVLIISPYYKDCLTAQDSTLHFTDSLQTYLDLYHFPLRGQETAEFLAGRDAQLIKVLKNE